LRNPQGMFFDYFPHGFELGNREPVRWAGYPDCRYGIRIAVENRCSDAMHPFYLFTPINGIARFLYLF